MNKKELTYLKRIEEEHKAFEKFVKKSNIPKSIKPLVIYASAYELATRRLHIISRSLKEKGKWKTLDK